MIVGSGVLVLPTITSEKSDEEKSDAVKKTSLRGSTCAIILLCETNLNDLDPHHNFHFQHSQFRPDGLPRSRLTLKWPPAIETLFDSLGTVSSTGSNLLFRF